MDGKSLEQVGEKEEGAKECNRKRNEGGKERWGDGRKTKSMNIGDQMKLVIEQT